MEKMSSKVGFSKLMNARQVVCTSFELVAGVACSGLGVVICAGVNPLKTVEKMSNYYDPTS